MEGIREFYNSNAEFRNYVDLYSAHYTQGMSISIDEALSHEIVRQVYERYKEIEEGRKNVRTVFESSTGLPDRNGDISKR